MASITLNDVVVDFPVYGMKKSLRKALFGVFMRRGEASEKRVVVRALSHMSLMLRDGDRLGLVGHNGAGKTTLLRVFAGIYAPTSGRIRIDGRVSTLFLTSPG